jgi:hypothetical protein
VDAPTEDTTITLLYLQPGGAATLLRALGLSCGESIDWCCVMAPPGAPNLGVVLSEFIPGGFSNIAMMMFNIAKINTRLQN